MRARPPFVSHARWWSTPRSKRKKLAKLTELDTRLRALYAERSLLTRSHLRTGVMCEDLMDLNTEIDALEFEEAHLRGEAWTLTEPTG